MYTQDGINKLISLNKEYDREYCLLSDFCLRVLDNMSAYMMGLDEVSNLCVFMGKVSFTATSTKYNGFVHISFPVTDLLKSPKEVGEQLVADKFKVIEEQNKQAKLDFERREKIKLKKLMKKYPDEVSNEVATGITLRGSI